MLVLLLSHFFVKSKIDSSFTAVNNYELLLQKLLQGNNSHRYEFVDSDSIFLLLSNKSEAHSL